jgi:hypothetical protein
MFNSEPRIRSSIISGIACDIDVKIASLGKNPVRGGRPERERNRRATDMLCT